jgi:hypothetical protein
MMGHFYRTTHSLIQCTIAIVFNYFIGLKFLFKKTNLTLHSKPLVQGFSIELNLLSGFHLRMVLKMIQKVYNSYQDFATKFYQWMKW